MEIDLAYKTTFNKNVSSLLDMYDLFPFHKHPLWKAIMNGELSRQQIILAESQHFLRTKAGQILRKEAMEQCVGLSMKLWESIVETYMEECTDNDGTPNHLDMIVRFLKEGGYNDFEIVKNTPGKIAVFEEFIVSCQNQNVNGANNALKKLIPLCRNKIRIELNYPK